MTEPAAPPQVEPLEGSFASVLCVVAHPDDIEYGTAAAVASWVGEGKTVTYFLLTRGEAGIDTMAPDEAARVREAGGARRRRAGRRRRGRLRRPPRRRRRVRPAAAPRHRPRDPPAPARPRRRRQLRRPVRPAACSTRPTTARSGWPRSTPSRTPATGGSSPSSLDEGLEPWGGSSALAVAGSPTPTHFVDVSGEHFDASVALARGARGLQRRAARTSSRSPPSCSA